MNERDKRIPLIVICIPGSDRKVPLLEKLRGSTIFRVEESSAVMYRRAEPLIHPNFLKQRTLYGRELSDGEIGCAISHQTIWALYSKRHEPIVILEDDARIQDMDKFQSLVVEFLKSYGKENAVLSLLPWKQEPRLQNFRPRLDRLPIVKLLGRTPLTVGYVITESAMSVMATANRDFAYLPDWPPTNTKFFTSIVGVISHGDHATYSLIDRTGPRVNEKRYKFYQLSLLPYLCNKRQFSSFLEFCMASWIPSITWRIDQIRVQMKVRGIF